MDQKKKESEKYKECNHHHELTDEQTLVDLGTGKFVADNEMLPVLTELNKIELISTKHCCGHGSGHSFLGLSSLNVNYIKFQIKIPGAEPGRGTRLVKEFSKEDLANCTEIVISWSRKGQSE